MADFNVGPIRACRRRHKIATEGGGASKGIDEGYKVEGYFLGGKDGGGGLEISYQCGAHVP